MACASALAYMGCGAETPMGPQRQSLGSGSQGYFVPLKLTAFYQLIHELISYQNYDFKMIWWNSEFWILTWLPRLGLHPLPCLCSIRSESRSYVTISPFTTIVHQSLIYVISVRYKLNTADIVPWADDTRAIFIHRFYLSMISGGTFARQGHSWHTSDFVGRQFTDCWSRSLCVTIYRPIFSKTRSTNHSSASPISADSRSRKIEHVLFWPIKIARVSRPRTFCLSVVASTYSCQLHRLGLVNYA